MWYVALEDLTRPCSWAVLYATSPDGQSWAGTSASARVFRRTDVPWAAGLPIFQGIVPGAIEPPDPSDPSPHYTLWFSVLAADPTKPGNCLPVSVGRATRP
jgi:hypothetical protein